MAGAGRRPGPLRGETPEAQAFAGWLRSVTCGWTQRELAETFNVGRTLWGQYLNGSKLPDRARLVGRVVETCFQEPRLREHRRAEGLELLRRAHEAKRGRGKPLAAGTAAADNTPARQASRVGELAVRLDDARKAQLEAERALFSTGHMVQSLLRLVAALESRCVRLEKERDKLKAVAHAEVRQELAESQQRLAAAENLLVQARRERRRAEEIRMDAHAMADQRQRETDTADGAAAGEGATSPQGPTGLPPLWEVDHLLETSHEQLKEHAEGLASLRERVTAPQMRPSQILPADELDPGWIRPHVVIPDRADNADNPAASGLGSPRARRSSILAESYRNQERVDRALRGPQTPPPPSLLERAPGRKHRVQTPGLKQSVLLALSTLPLITAAATFTHSRQQARPLGGWHAEWLVGYGSYLALLGLICCYLLYITGSAVGFLVQHRRARLSPRYPIPPHLAESPRNRSGTA